MSKIEYMKVIATSLSPFPNLLRDLKNNLTFGKLVWFFIYCIYALYIGQITDRIIGSSNLHTQLLLSIIFYTSEISILLFVFFYLKKVYLNIISTRKEFEGKNYNDNNFRNIYLFRVFLFSILFFYFLLSHLKIFQYSYILFFIIILFILVYSILLPPFIIIEKPNISYFLSFKIIVKAVGLQFFKLLFIIFITTIIFEIICIPLYHFPIGYVAYKIVVSNDEDVTTGILFAVAAVCNFITVYIGIIIYTKLSLEIYLKFKKRILYELTKVNNTPY